MRCMQCPVIREDLKLDIGNEWGPSLARKILSFVQTILLIWQSLSENDIQVTPISAAMTNFVYLITVNMQNGLLRDEEDTYSKLINEPESLLLRVYGESNWMFDRKNEIIATMKLAETGAVPGWYAVFENGRLEEYILSNFVPANQFRETTVCSLTIAGLGKIHQQLDSVLAAGSTWTKEDYLWRRLAAWKSKAKEAISRLSQIRGVGNIQKILDLGVIDSEAESLSIELAKSVQSPIVLGHCDEAGTCRIVIIDLEYAIPTTRAFDLANFFNEFVYDYNSSSTEIVNPAFFPSTSQMDHLLSSYSLESVSTQEIWPFFPIVQLLWGYWSIIKAVEDRHNNDYNYLLAAEQRFRRFQELYDMVSMF